MQIITSFPVADKIIEQYSEQIKKDLPGYRNHVTRMLNYCHSLKPDLSEQDSTKLQIAGAFHDIGLWTDDRVDYLDPSVEVCMQYLEQQGLTEWQQEIAIIIDMHHYIKPYRGKHQQLAELFRRADLVDFSLGLVKFGISSAFISQLKRAIPNAGFHRTLLRFSALQLTRNPLNPLPMMRLRNKYKSL